MGWIFAAPHLFWARSVHRAAPEVPDLPAEPALSIIAISWEAALDAPFDKLRAFDSGRPKAMSECAEQASRMGLDQLI